MNNNFIEFIKGTFEDPGSLDLDKVRKIVFETNTYFEALENTLKHGDLEEREAALASVFEMKEFLDSKADQMPPERHLDALSNEERELLAEMAQGINLEKSKKRETKIKKLKPIKMR
jgi:hypothetical protein